MHPSRSSNPPQRPGNPSPDYPARFEHFLKQTIIMEREIKMEELGLSFVGTTMHQMGWNLYVRHPIQASKNIVHEFYAATVPNLFMTGAPVVLHGRSVYIRAEDNAFHGTVNHTNLACNITREPCLTSFIPDLTSDLRVNGTTVWNVSNVQL
ncbi:hypothetical protein ACOSQ3_003324 [Xanthoceras sorbifolium]